MDSLLAAVKKVVFGGTTSAGPHFVSTRKHSAQGPRLHEFIKANTIELAAPRAPSWDTDDSNWCLFGSATFLEPTVTPHIEVAARVVDIRMTSRCISADLGRSSFPKTQHLALTVEDGYESELALIDCLLSEAADSLVTLELAVQKTFCG